MKTSLIQIRIGDKVIYDPNGKNYEVTVIDYKLVPNGIDDPTIVALITAQKEGYTIEATAKHFITKDYESYESVYQPFINK